VTHLFNKYSNSAVALIIANLTPLFGALFLGWEIFDILFIYWFEGLIIGFFNIFKILFTPMAHDTTTTNLPKPIVEIILLPVKVITIAFFIVHYGLFMAGHGFLLLYLFGNVPKTAFQNFSGALLLFVDLAIKLKIALLSLFISHGLSFVKNFLLGQESSEGKNQEFFFSPYKRILIMHLTIVLCAGITLATGQNIYILVGLIIMKIATDLWSHLMERKRFSSEAIIKPAGKLFFGFSSWFFGKIAPEETKSSQGWQRFKNLLD